MTLLNSPQQKKIKSNTSMTRQRTHRTHASCMLALKWVVTTILLRLYPLAAYIIIFLVGTIYTPQHTIGNVYTLADPFHLPLIYLSVLDREVIIRMHGRSCTRPTHAPATGSKYLSFQSWDPSPGTPHTSAWHFPSGGATRSTSR